MTFVRVGDGEWLAVEHIDIVIETDSGQDIVAARHKYVWPSGVQLEGKLTPAGRRWLRETLWMLYRGGPWKAAHARRYPRGRRKR